MRTTLALLLPVALNACSSGAQSPPSLLPRPMESSIARPESAPPAPALIADSALKERIASLLADVRTGETTFSDIERSQSAALKGASSARGSEAWIIAQSAISALQAARQTSASALAELDTLAIETAQAAANDPKIGGLAEIAAARAEALAIVDQQNVRLERFIR